MSFPEAVWKWKDAAFLIILDCSSQFNGEFFFCVVKDINIQCKVWGREDDEESNETCLFPSFEDKIGIYKWKFIRANAMK